jgi:hypothetical protein
LTNFDGIELHPIFLQTLMDFDGYQPIRILFWNDEMMFTKQKHMVIKRRRATRSWLLRRKQYNTLLKELHTEDPNEFRNYFRMDKTTFKMLLEKVRPLIERQDTSGSHGCTRLATASDKVFQLLAHGRWFSPGIPAYSTTKTGRYDIAEILQKVAFKHNK